MPRHLACLPVNVLSNNSTPAGREQFCRPPDRQILSPLDTSMLDVLLGKSKPPFTLLRDGVGFGVSVPAERMHRTSVGNIANVTEKGLLDFAAPESRLAE